jgi:hypothetical protein
VTDEFSRLLVSSIEVFMHVHESKLNPDDSFVLGQAVGTIIRIADMAVAETEPEPQLDYDGM